MLPLYEAKMLHHYDHRWATYEGSTVRDVDVAEKVDPEFSVVPRYWVARDKVDDQLNGRWRKHWFVGWRDIGRSTDERTMITSAFPYCAVGNKIPLMLAETQQLWCLQANLSSFVMDFASRQKVGSASLNYYLVMQFPVLPPSIYDEAVKWSRNRALKDWVRDRVLELSYTAWDMAEFAAELEDKGPPFRWDEARRTALRAELDAAYFHLYGTTRPNVEHILDTFLIVRRKDEAAFGEYRTKRLILEIYDAMAEAIATGSSYSTDLDPPPGHGPRHRER
jgi:hypothetical protein